MKTNLLLALPLFLLALATALGFVVKIPNYWFVLDFFVMLVCVTVGTVLLVSKKPQP